MRPSSIASCGAIPSCVDKRLVLYTKTQRKVPDSGASNGPAFSMVRLVSSAANGPCRTGREGGARHGVDRVPRRGLRTGGGGGGSGRGAAGGRGGRERGGGGE